MVAKKTAKETVEKVEVENVVEETKPQRKLENNTEIRVANNTRGVLFYKSPRTQQDWLFHNYGDEDVMELHELRTMKSQHPAFFTEKWLRVIDEDAIKFLRLEKYYEDMVSPEELVELFELSAEEVGDCIDKASTNMKALILSKAREKYQYGELTDIHIIKVIEKKLDAKVDINE